MQCPSCQFRNMPGVAICGRCGGNLRVDSMDIDVNPPRAADRGFWQRTFPHFSIHGGRYWSSFWEFLTQTRISIFGDWDIAEVDPEPVIRRLIVPGWPQIYCGRVRRGQIFLGLYLFFLLAGLVLLGSFWGNQLLGLAVACHISSVLDIALMGERQLMNRIKRSVTWTLLVIVLIYVPVSILFTQVVSANVVNAAMPPFQQGDVLLVNQLMSPDPGDVVLYNIPPTTINTGGQYLRLQGPRIDRILAGPGQEVTTRQGDLLIDGRSADFLPCNPHKPLPALNMTVPVNSFLILPSSDPNVPSEIMPEVAVVSSQQITGRVYFRNLPFSRFGFIR